MQKGRILRKESPKQLLQELEGKVWNVYLSQDKLRDYEKEGKKIVNLSYAGDQICARILSEEKIEDKMAELIHPTLEDVYLYYEN